MPRNKPITIAGREYGSKKAAAERCRGMLRFSPDGRVLTGGDEKFASALLERHPSFVAKSGCGVSCIKVIANSFGVKHFHAIRHDGTSTEFSWKKCLRHAEPAHADIARVAFRNEVYAAIVNYKARMFGSAKFTPSELSVCVLSWPSSVVLHKPPQTFNAVLEEFCKDFCVDINTVPVTRMRTRLWIQDRHIACYWRTFHKRESTLQLVSEDEAKRFG